MMIPIVVTPVEIVTDVSPVHPLKALPPNDRVMMMMMIMMINDDDDDDDDDTDNRNTRRNSNSC